MLFWRTWDVLGSFLLCQFGQFYKALEMPDICKMLTAVVGRPAPSALSGLHRRLELGLREKQTGALLAVFFSSLVL